MGRDAGGVDLENGPLLPLPRHVERGEQRRENRQGEHEHPRPVELARLPSGVEPEPRRDPNAWRRAAGIELPVWRNAGLSVHAFGDAGAIVFGGFGRLGASTGFGVLWRTPLGPFGVDLAFPLDGGKPMWLVNVGGAF